MNQILISIPKEILEKLDYKSGDNLEIDFHEGIDYSLCKKIIISKGIE